MPKNHGFASRRPPGSQRGQASSSRTCDVGRFGAICDQQKTVRSGLEMLSKNMPLQIGVFGGFECVNLFGIYYKILGQAQYSMFLSPILS